MFHLFGQMFSGLVIGTLARLLMPGQNPAGIITTPLLGLSGSVAGTLLARYLFGDSPLVVWVCSVTCSTGLLLICWFATMKESKIIPKVANRFNQRIF